MKSLCSFWLLLITLFSVTQATEKESSPVARQTAFWPCEVANPNHHPGCNVQACAVHPRIVCAKYHSNIYNTFCSFAWGKCHFQVFPGLLISSATVDRTSACAGCKCRPVTPRSIRDSTAEARPEFFGGVGETSPRGPSGGRGNPKSSSSEGKESGKKRKAGDSSGTQRVVKTSKGH